MPGLDPRTPVLVGGGQLNQRVDRGEPPLEPVDMMAEALRRAATDTGARDPGAVLAGADTIAAVNVISWRYQDPAALVAPRVGATPRRTWHTGAAGSSPQALVSTAARDIAAGDADLVLVCGAEAWRTRMALRGEGDRPGWTVQDESVRPTWSLGEGFPLASQAEMARGIVLPVQLYPIFESAVRAKAGRTPTEHVAHISALWARFSDVAATNPAAWIQRSYTAEEIATPGPENRMVGYPYTKLMNSNSAVEQGAGLVICSVERAEALGIPRDRWVFPWSGADANDTEFVSNRPDLGGSPAIRACGAATLGASGVGIDEVAHVDLYSCFPSAVQVAADELGLAHDRQLTVTGGLSFAGGPWNNYVTHSIATMAGVLRADPGSLGLITANGGYLTKHALGLYSTEPPPHGGFRWSSAQAAADGAGRVESVDEWDGPVTVEACTVMHDREGDPENGIAACRTADGRRTWAVSSEPGTMKAMATDETVGLPAAITGGTLHLT